MKRKLFALAAILSLLTSCSKDNQQHGVPNLSFHFYEYLTAYPYSALQVPGNWLYVTGGSKGIFIYRIGINVNGTDESGDFAIYDRNCTYQPLNADAIVSVQPGNVYLVDSSCGSKFYILTGGVANGPATMKLKSYNYTYDPSSLQLYIYN